MESKPKEIAEILLDLKAVKLKPTDPFTWASGIRSPIYCDNRITLSHPEERKFMARSLMELVPDWDQIDLVAGVATAGIPYASILAHMTEKPLIYVRSAAKSHGRQNVIEGSYKAGQRVIVVEDLISTGGSVLEAVSQLKDADVEVTGVVAIFTYQLRDAEENFNNMNVKYKTLSHYEALLEQALEMNYIKNEHLTILKEWNKSPKTWQNG